MAFHVAGQPADGPAAVCCPVLHGSRPAPPLAVGFWSGEQDVIDNWAEDKRWEPNMADDERDRQYRLWKKAVTKTFDWVDDDVS